MTSRRSSTARGLAKERAQWLKERDRAELARLKGALAEAQKRRRDAVRAAVALCRRARLETREKVQAWRKAEIARINQTARELRTQARNRCQARQHRIRSAGGRAVDQRRAELAEQEKYQRQIEQANRRAVRQRSTTRERAQEDDDHVRGNLPAELVPVFERVKRHIKGDKRTTRTEAFLEWAESHPEDVLAYQQHETDAEVRRLIAEHDAAERRLRKTKGKAPRRRRAVGDAEEVPF